MAGDCLERIPTSEEIRQRIAQTYQEARALKTLLRAAEQREKMSKAPVRMSSQSQGGRK